MSDIKHDPIANACYHFAIQLGITDTEKRENFINWASKQAAEINELKNELAFQIRRNEVNETSICEKIECNKQLKADNAQMREALGLWQAYIDSLSGCTDDVIPVEVLDAYNQAIEKTEQALKGGK